MPNAIRSTPNRASQTRRLRLQSLESRNLLAGDIGGELLNADVNGDGDITPLDALQVINAIRIQNEAGGVGLERFDVNKDGKLSALDALSVINRLNGQRDRESVESTPLRGQIVDRIANPMADRDPAQTLGDGAIREIASTLQQRRQRSGPIEGLKELVQTAREDGEVTDVEKAEIRELVSTEFADRGRDGSNVDPERQENRQERRAERQERREERQETRQPRDGAEASQRGEQLRERLAAGRNGSDTMARMRRR